MLQVILRIKNLCTEILYNFRTNQVRVNIDAKVTESLSVGVNASGRNENRFQSPISSGTMFWKHLWLSISI